MPGTDINELIEGLRRHGELEYQRGVEEGRRLERSLMLAYLSEATPPAQVASSPSAVLPSTEAATVSEERSDRRKAPKGLIETITKRILNEHPGLRLSDLEVVVLDADPRIAKKSVYNHLNANRETLYRHENGHWYLRESAPVGAAWTDWAAKNSGEAA